MTKSLFQSTLFDHGRKPQTAETIEIENLCDNSQSGSFQSSAYGGVPIDLERESTMESLPVSFFCTSHLLPCTYNPLALKSQDFFDIFVQQNPVIANTQ